MGGSSSNCRPVGRSQISRQCDVATDANNVLAVVHTSTTYKRTLTIDKNIKIIIINKVTR